MSKVTWKGSVLLAPLPAVLVSCGSAEKPNIITIGWTGVICSRPPITYISVRPERYSFELIRSSGEFVINIPSSSMARKVDFCGIYTGAKVDKFARCDFTPQESVSVSCPGIAEAPLSLECRVREIKEFGEDATHVMFIADIMSVRAEESLLDESGRLCLERAKPLGYSHGEYYEPGRFLGKIGFSTDKPGKKSGSVKGKPTEKPKKTAKTKE